LVGKWATLISPGVRIESFLVSGHSSKTLETAMRRVWLGLVVCVFGGWGVLVSSAGASSSSSVVVGGVPPTVAPVVAGSRGRVSRASGRSVVRAGVGTAVAVGQLPTGVAVTDATAVVTNSDSGSLSVVDLGSDAVTSTIPVGSFPVAVALSSDGLTAYVANFKGNSLSVVDLSTGAVTKTVGVGSRPDGVVVSGGLVYVANLLDGTVSVVDPGSGAVTATVSLPGSDPAPSGLAVSADGHELYVDDARNGTTDVVDLTQSPPVALSGQASVGTYPAYLAVRGALGFVADATKAASTPGTVSVLDLSDPTHPVTTADVSVGSHPYGIADAPGLGEVLVSNSGDGTLDAVDTVSRALVQTVGVGSTPDAVAVTPDQSTAVVSDEGDDDVRILHIDQAPVLSVPGAQSVLGNATGSSGNELTFSAGQAGVLSVADTDAGANPEQVTLSVAHGTLQLSGESGLTFSAGSDGSSSMTFSGSVSDIDAALDGLTYEPATGYTGSDAVDISVDDLGHTGDIGTAQTTSASVAVTDRNIDPGSDSFSGAVGNTSFGVGVTPAAPSTHTTGSLLANASAVNGASLTAVPGTVSTTNGGSVSISSDGTFTYHPPAGYTGTDTFAFSITDGSSTATGTASVTVAGMVWYVQNNATGANAGTSTDPFTTLAAAQNASGAGDTIYIFQGDGTTTGQDAGITLQDNQTLEGQADDLVIGSQTLYSGNQSDRPDIGNSAGSGVTTGSGDTIEGLNIAANGSGAAITNARNANGGTVSDDVVSGAGGAGGILLYYSAGTWNISGLTDTVTGTGTALEAQNGGTLNVTGATNTLSSQTGEALYLSTTTIGSSGLTFESISAGTSTAGPAFGIILSTTGSGSLTVTGDGSAGSGGTISQASGNGMSLSGTGSVSVNDMNVAVSAADTNAYVLYASDVSSLGIANSTITGGSTDFGMSDFSDSGTGTFDLQGNTITGIATGMYVYSYNSGTLAGTATSNTITATNTGIDLEAPDAGTVTADVESNTVSAGTGLSGSATGTLNLTANGNTFTAYYGMYVSSNGNVCLDTASNAPGPILVYQGSDTSTFAIQGLGASAQNHGGAGTDPAVAAYLHAQNPTSASTFAYQPSTAGFTSAAACPTPASVTTSPGTVRPAHAGAGASPGAVGAAGGAGAGAPAPGAPPAPRPLPRPAAHHARPRTVRHTARSLPPRPAHRRPRARRTTRARPHHGASHPLVLWGAWTASW
jgi:YVTN family beta-propeller protein